MTWHKWFIPHRDTHQKAHLISWEALIIYSLLFIGLQVTFSLVKTTKPGVLGTSSNIEIQKVIELTNVQRAKNGLPPVSENPALDKAARAKAQNMFSENYWAHFAPSGKSPWDFILGSGYKFTYAGENLAKNFSNSDDVITAWMASPSHKENIVNSNYKDIGIAVEDGVIDGQHTTLVVQMFGSTSVLAAALPSLKQEAKPPPSPQIEIPQKEYQQKSRIALVQPVVVKSETQTTLFDPFTVSKTVSLSIIMMVSVLLMLDLYILRRRGVLRITSHHLAHMALISVAAASILSSHSGDISQGLSFKGPMEVIQGYETSH